MQVSCSEKSVLLISDDVSETAEGLKNSSLVSFSCFVAVEQTSWLGEKLKLEKKRVENFRLESATDSLN